MCKRCLIGSKKKWQRNLVSTKCYNVRRIALNVVKFYSASQNVKQPGTNVNYRKKKALKIITNLIYDNNANSIIIIK